jgi:hypothetical protein
MEVARYVGDAVPNGNRFWHLAAFVKLETSIQASMFSARSDAWRKH